MASLIISEAAAQAWVTLATNDSYCLGALVLGNSLTRSGTTRKKVCMISKGVSEAMRGQLQNTFDEVVDVEEFDSKDLANLSLLERPELGITFTKLHCWNLVQYEKCVFLDADTMVIRNCDELFNREELSAAPDAGWPDCFNSGVFVLKPSHDTYKALIQHANSEGSFDGGDQGLLNTFFSDWATKDIGRHLSFLYNMCATATYTYLPAYKKYGNQVKIIHFIGVSKPWHVQFDPSGQPQPRLGEEHTLNHLKNWWHIFHSDVKPKLGEKLCYSCLGYCPSGDWCAEIKEKSLPPLRPEPPMAMVQTPGGGAAFMPTQQQSGDNRVHWEEGRPDYLGHASFDNILKKIESTMSSPEEK
ncbi:glycogenin-1-like isoform X4 [Tigriopus californicus]|uniref:glycogenin-1-like isoform X4 n=1 Tax=Tigriopus californicus TaxID=6832 RepID=UPI0027D9E1D2|nr:glycogenin-1-like isoform X4 [Tigriopus californicus]